MDASKQQWHYVTRNSVKPILWTVVLAAALLTTTLAVPALQHADKDGHALNSGGWLSDIRGYLRNPLDYFMQRSPGTRGSGKLIQTKHRMVKLSKKAVKPQEQVLSNIRYAPPIPAFINDLLPITGPGLIDTDFPSLPIGGGPIGSTPSIPSPVVPVVIPPGGGGGGGGGNTSVPEPSTWFTLIWGMALAGIGLRSKYRPLAKTARIGLRVKA